jgi:hypothetical protein
MIAPIRCYASFLFVRWKAGGVDVDQDVLDLRRLDFVAGSYSELGALRLVPVGLFALVMAVLVGGWVQLSAYWESVVGAGALGAAVVGFWLAAFWYRNNYGMTLEAWPGSEREARRWALVWAGAAAMVVVGVAQFGAVAELFGYLGGAAVMGWMLLYWRRAGRIWPHGYALTALLAIGGLLHQGASLPFLGQGLAAWVLALLGAVLVMVGIAEHRRLAGAAKPLEEDGDE